MALSVCAVLAACAGPSPAEAPPPPAVAWAVRHYEGSTVSGPAGPWGSAASAPPVEPDAALQVRVRWVGLTGLPSDRFQPLASRRRLLLDLEAPDVLRAVPRLSAGARAATLTDPEADLAALLGQAGAWRLGAQRAALPVGITAELSLQAAGAPGGLALRLHRRLDDGGGPALDVALLLERGGRCPRRELVVLTPLAGDRLALGLLAAWPGLDGLALGAVIELGPPPGPHEPGRVAHRAAYAACLADVARDRALARAAAERDPAPSITADDEVGLGRALSALRERAHRRGALFALARRTGARLAEDVALGADEPLLEAVAAAALEASQRLGAARGAALGWALERAAIRAVAASAEASPPAPGATGLLVRAAGVAGAYPQTLRELAGAADGLAAWRARLEEVNAAALDDPSPLQRVLAAEWLARRRAGVTDPLGSARAAGEEASR